MSNSTLVRVKLQGIVFPDICPVCGNPATAKGFIGKNTSSKTNGFFDIYYQDLSSYSVKHVISFSPKVCNEHRIPVGEVTRFDAVNTLFGTIFLGAALIILAHIFFMLYDSLYIPPTTFLLLAICFTLAGVILIGMRPPELYRYISIKSVEPNLGYAILRIKHDWYLEQFLALNPHRAVIHKDSLLW